MTVLLYLLFYSLLYHRYDPLCGMAVAAAHELVLKVDDLLLIEALIDVPDGIQQFVLVLYHRSRRQIEIVIVESAPVAVILVIIRIEDHRFLKERILEDEG